MATQLPFFHRRDEHKPSYMRPGRKIILVFLIIFGLMLILRSRQSSDSTFAGDYTIDPLQWPILFGNERGESAFSPEMFSTEALSKNNFKAVTAVILRLTDDEKTIVDAVQHLLKYPFIREIFIYNVIVARPLHISQFNLNSGLHTAVNVEIFEATESLGTLARFTFCSMAQYEHCFFQDDAWTNSFLDSLYTNFLRYPDLVHASTLPSQAPDQLRWRFRNEAISMHTGYAEFKYGTFAPRWKAQTFLTQLSKTSLTKDRIKQADHYFSIWTNQYPWIYSIPEQESILFGDIDRKASDLRPYIYDAARHLQVGLELLATGVGMDHFSEIEDTPSVHQRDVRSLCGNDKCLFATNMDLQHNIPEFDSGIIKNMKEWEKLYNSGLQTSTAPTIQASNFHFAVDQRPQTCWSPAENPKAGDYFGLLMVGPIKTNTITLHGRVGGGKTEQIANMLKVSVLEKGSEWVTCKTKVSAEPGRIALSFGCPDVKMFRALRIIFTKGLSERFELCGLDVGEISL